MQEYLHFSKVKKTFLTKAFFPRIFALYKCPEEIFWAGETSRHFWNYEGRYLFCFLKKKKKSIFVSHCMHGSWLNLKFGKKRSQWAAYLHWENIAYKKNKAVSNVSFIPSVSCMNLKKYLAFLDLSFSQ